MDDEKRKILPPGALHRICKPKILEKGCRFSNEYIPALNKAISKLVVDITNEACDKALLEEKKQLKLTHLKDAADRFGILVE